MRDDFAIFILSHGRADIMKTINTIKRCGYTGKYYVICDNEDTTIDKYYNYFGREHIIVFDKSEAAEITDTMDNIDKRNSIVFARNMCHEIAENLKLKYFLELEDDYTEFRSRNWNGSKLSSIYCKDLDSIINEVLEFLDTSGALTIAFAQTGDFIGGVGSKVYKERLTRKAMNSFFAKLINRLSFLVG